MLKTTPCHKALVLRPPPHGPALQLGADAAVYFLPRSYTRTSRISWPCTARSLEGRATRPPCHTWTSLSSKSSWRALCSLLPGGGLSTGCQWVGVAKGDSMPPGGDSGVTGCPLVGSGHRVPLGGGGSRGQHAGSQGLETLALSSRQSPTCEVTPHVVWWLLAYCCG